MRRLFSSLVAAALLLAAPLVAQEGETSPQAPEPPIAVGTNAVADGEISERIATILQAVPGFAEVSAAVSGGVVTLTGSVPEAASAERIENIVGRIEGVVTVENAIEASADVGERLTPGIGRVEERLRQTLALLPLLAIALAVLLAISALGWLLTRGRGLFDRIAPNAFIADIFRQIVRIVFVFAGIVVALDLVGATALLGTLLGAAGIIGLAVSFGVRDTIENFVASVMMSVRQPFSPNDLVEIDGQIGNVIRLTSRATVLLSPDGNHVRIPNAIVFKSLIVNYSREPQRRFQFDLGVDPACDLAAARDTGLAALRQLDFVLTDPEAAAWVERAGDSAIILTFTGWIDQRRTDFPTARGEAIRITKAALEASGVTLPEPGYRLRISRDTGPAEAPSERAPASGALPDARAAVAPKVDAIERKVEADRRAAPASDLLDPERPAAE